uniref:Putative secreted protein n=1 Tax=Anopheles darlingi TaxID=43151 RepID=A0A2M4D889_ANODA
MWPDLLGRLRSTLPGLATAAAAAAAATGLFQDVLPNLANWVNWRLTGTTANNGQGAFMVFTTTTTTTRWHHQHHRPAIRGNLSNRETRASVVHTHRQPFKDVH